MKDGDELLKKHHNAKNCIKLYDDVFTYTSQFINTYTGRQFIYSLLWYWMGCQSELVSIQVFIQLNVGKDNSGEEGESTVQEIASDSNEFRPSKS